MYVQTWERSLLALANQGQGEQAAPARQPVADRALLDRAYAYCAWLTRAASHTFFLASRLLPPEKRRAVRALYAFCRRSDDIVDGAGRHGASAPTTWALCPPIDDRVDVAAGNVNCVLAAWRQRALAEVPPPEDLVAVAWADARYRYRIPHCYTTQLLAGIERDLRQVRYDTFDDLAAYAYGVASTVGLMSMHIIGYSGPEAIPYAVKLGVALQLTNILRDVGEDWRAGRVYLPRDELAAHGLAEADLERGQVDARWRAFMRFQIERTRRLYAEAWPGISLLHWDGRLAIAAAGAFYRQILTDIERHDYDVFHRRAHVSTWGKLRRLPGLWWSTQ
jgi:phytoene synthase